MSCSCNCNPCSHTTCNTTNEPVASQLNNFVLAFFGSLTKTCVNNQVTWELPCDLNSGSPEFHRLPGEGMACYFLRFINTFRAAQEFAIGNKGYRSTPLSNTDVVLFRNVDVINQDFTGTLTGPVDIIFSSNGAENGDEFYVSFTNLVITATNNIEFKSDGVSLLLIDTPGTLNGFFKAVYTGTEWKLTLTTLNIS